jgi:transposase
VSTVTQALGWPEIEVVAKATRRRYTLEYKRKIVREADGCKTPGAVGALLRREGLYSSHYSSHLTTWRAARERGALVGTQSKRGPARRVTDSRDKVIAEQARELTRWKYRAERAEALVEVQKKVAALLGTPLDGERS